MKFTNPQRLTHLQTKFTSVVFNRTGDKIAFACVTRRRSAIGLMSSSGSNLTFLAGLENVTDDAYYDLQFTNDDSSLVCSIIEEDGEFSDLLWIDLKTSKQVRLTHGRNAGYPALSPDCRHIIFEAWQNGGSDLWRLDKEKNELFWTLRGPLTALSTEEAHRAKDLLPRQSRNSSPRWNPSGTHICFTTSAYLGKSKRPSQLCRIRPDGLGLIHLTDSASDSGDPLWNSDGTKIAFTIRNAIDNKYERKLWKNRTNIHIADSDGTHMHQVEDSNSVNHLGSFHISGRYLAFASSCEERFHDGWRNWDIQVINIKTGEIFAVTNNNIYDSKPLFNPNGKSLLFVSASDDQGGITGNDLYSIKLIE